MAMPPIPPTTVHRTLLALRHDKADCSTAGTCCQAPPAAVRAGVMAAVLGLRTGPSVVRHDGYYFSLFSLFETALAETDVSELNGFLLVAQNFHEHFL